LKTTLYRALLSFAGELLTIVNGVPPQPTLFRPPAPPLSPLPSSHPLNSNPTTEDGPYPFAGEIVKEPLRFFQNNPQSLGVFPKYVFHRIKTYFIPV